MNSVVKKYLGCLVVRNLERVNLAADDTATSHLVDSKLIVIAAFKLISTILEE